MTTTEDHWTWHLALFPWGQHSFGSRCWSGLLGRGRLAARGTARKVVGWRCLSSGSRFAGGTGFGPELLGSEALLDRHFGVGRVSFGSPRTQARTDTVPSEQAFEGRSPREHRATAVLQRR
jgi:hypothetical protein